MREIKFRVYSFTDSKMRFISFKQNSDNTSMNIDLGHINGTHKKSDFMMFAGLRDKNGVDIYEGDVISYLYGAGIDSTSVVRYEAEHAGFSPFYDEGWYCRVSEYEVIGNIYENQNLLESTE